MSVRKNYNFLPPKLLTYIQIIYNFAVQRRTKTMMQAKFAKNGFSNTTSGKMNTKTNLNKFKQIQLEDDEVQMFSPQFLQAKTLKKPFKDLDLSLQKTNPQGVQYKPFQEKQFSTASNHNQIPTKDNWTQKEKTHSENQQKIQLIQTKGLNIQPAFKKQEKQTIEVPTILTDFKDKNSLISVLMRKGENKIDLPMEINIKKPVDKKVGPAQTKLKTLFKKQTKITTNEKPKRLQIQEEIGEDIYQSIKQEYNESFQKFSGSGIKESIREEIGGSSGLIKESIRQSIRESIRQSIRDEVPAQSINEYKDSFHSFQDSGIKEEIMESIKKSKDSEEEVYEEIFQEESISDEISKSRSSRFKKSKEDQRFQLSISASKGWRTKTNAVVKSIKLAEELSYQNQKKLSHQKIQQKLNKGDKIAEQIIKEKASLEKIQTHISQFFAKKKTQKQEQKSNRNKDILYKFRVQINRLLTSENFMSKLRKITQFIHTDEEKSNINELQDKLLKNVLEQLQSIKKAEIGKEQMLNMKKQYDQKLQRMLKQQQMNLRVEMDKKLYQKDVQLKKMIAQLEQKFMQGKYVKYSEYDGQKRPMKSDKVQIQSDYSIDSDDISWKMDLWELLPDYQKKRFYQKQANQVTKFLTQALFNEIKQQSLDRQCDISFQFPDDLSLSGSFPEIKKVKRETQETEQMLRPAFDRQKLREEYEGLPPLKQTPIRSQIPVPLQVGGINESMSMSDKKTPRDTISKGEIIKILSKYKNLYIKKKNDIIRKISRTLQTKSNDPINSVLNEIRILNQKDVKRQDLPFIKAYEETIIYELVGIFNKNANKKNQSIEEQMRKMYERFIVTCQVKAADIAVEHPLQIVPNETYVDYRLKKQQNRVKDDVVGEIIKILAGQFAREMPKRKK